MNEVPERSSDGDRRGSFGRNNADRNDARNGGRSSFGGSSRSVGRGNERSSRSRDDEEWTPRYSEHPKAPAIPDEITEKDVPVMIRVALKTLSLENANRVARHLAMVTLLIDQDPQLALEHAQAAAARAGRIAVVRETLGVAAYRVGDFALALRELTTYRRLSGLNDQLPIMVDCERGIGKPAKALELGRDVDRNKLEPEVRVNLAIALSGARLDLGENDLALAELEIAELNPKKVFDYSAPLFFAYSDTLEILGRKVEAEKWLKLAERAVEAFTVNAVGENEFIQVLEEIEIPAETTRTEKPKRDDDRISPRFGNGNRFSNRGDSRDRGPSRRGESDRSERSTGEEPKRAPWRKPE
jgi:tetratricopeptide (TPR) repeat protein